MFIKQLYFFLSVIAYSFNIIVTLLFITKEAGLIVNKLPIRATLKFKI